LIDCRIPAGVDSQQRRLIKNIVSVIITTGCGLLGQYPKLQ